MGIVLSAFVWPYAIMNLPTGWAIDRFGARTIMAFAAGAWSIVAILTGAARSVGAFIGLRVALGVTEAPMFPAALKATDAWFPDREKAAATSVYISGTQVSLAIAAPIATALMLASGWPAMFVIMGLLGFVALAGWLVLYREPADSRWASADELAYIRAGQLAHDEGAAAAGRKATGREWASLFRHPTTWVMMAGAFGLQSLQDPPHGGGTHPDAQAGQLASDPLVAPSPGSPAPSARSAPQPADPLVAVLPWQGRSSASGPAAGASQRRARCHQPGHPKRPGGAIGPRRQALPGPPPSSARPSTSSASRTAWDTRSQASTESPCIPAGRRPTALHAGDPQVMQAASQRQQRAGGRAVLTHLLPPPALILMRNPDAGHHAGLANVQRGHPLDQLARFLGLFHHSAAPP